MNSDTTNTTNTTNINLSLLAQTIKVWGRELGFAEIRITDLDLPHAEKHLQAWLEQGYHGEMAYMAAHGTKRARPAELMPGAVRAIMVRMNYLPRATPLNWQEKEWAQLHNATSATISVYARGRDYHKVMRGRLQQLATRIEAEIGAFGYRVFCDSAPVPEVALAEKAGLGWRGKHTLMLNRQAGSMFFLGEILTNIALPVDAPTTAHCGQCTACIEVCPTKAILGPHQIDARRCIAYLTIELKGSIPVAMRALIGNRIYGCDDCQLVCPWNKFAQRAELADFNTRHGLDHADMVALFSWTEEEFNQRMEGSAIRRIGYERWLRNLAVGLGNVAQTQPGHAEVVASLKARIADPSMLVHEHIVWALAQHGVWVI